MWMPAGLLCIPADNPEGHGLRHASVDCGFVTGGQAGRHAWPGYSRHKKSGEFSPLQYLNGATGYR